MSTLLFRIRSKLFRTLFSLLHRSRFKSLGRAAYLYSPFRVDGQHNVEIGALSVFQGGSWLYCIGIDGGPAQLSIGKGCVFGYNNHVTAVAEVVIGDHVLPANNVYISDNLHGYEDVDVPIMHQPVRVKRPVHIGSGSWIGENVCIIGATVGKNCVIGANAVVTSDIPDYSVAVGAPAVVIRRYDGEKRQWIKVSGESPALGKIGCQEQY